MAFPIRKAKRQVSGIDVNGKFATHELTKDDWSDKQRIQQAMSQLNTDVIDKILARDTQLPPDASTETAMSKMKAMFDKNIELGADGDMETPMQMSIALSMADAEHGSNAKNGKWSKFSETFGATFNTEKYQNFADTIQNWGREQARSNPEFALRQANLVAAAADKSTDARLPWTASTAATAQLAIDEQYYKGLRGLAKDKDGNVISPERAKADYERRCAGLQQQMAADGLAPDAFQTEYIGRVVEMAEADPSFRNRYNGLTLGTVQVGHGPNNEPYLQASDGHKIASMDEIGVRPVQTVEQIAAQHYSNQHAMLEQSGAVDRNAVSKAISKDAASRYFEQGAISLIKDDMGALPEVDTLEGSQTFFHKGMVAEKGGMNPQTIIRGVTNMAANDYSAEHGIRGARRPELGKTQDNLFMHSSIKSMSGQIPPSLSAKATNMQASVEQLMQNGMIPQQMVNPEGLDMPGVGVPTDTVPMPGIQPEDMPGPDGEQQEHSAEYQQFLNNLGQSQFQQTDYSAIPRQGSAAPVQSYQGAPVQQAPMANVPSYAASETSSVNTQQIAQQFPDVSPETLENIVAAVQTQMLDKMNEQMETMLDERLRAIGMGEHALIQQQEVQEAKDAVDIQADEAGPVDVEAAETVVEAVEPKQKGSYGVEVDTSKDGLRKQNFDIGKKFADFERKADKKAKSEIGCDYKDEADKPHTMTLQERVDYLVKKGTRKEMTDFIHEVYAGSVADGTGFGTFQNADDFANAMNYVPSEDGTIGHVSAGELKDGSGWKKSNMSVPNMRERLSEVMSKAMAHDDKTIKSTSEIYELRHAKYLGEEALNDFNNRKGTALYEQGTLEGTLFADAGPLKQALAAPKEGYDYSAEAVGASKAFFAAMEGVRDVNRPVPFGDDKRAFAYLSAMKKNDSLGMMRAIADEYAAMSVEERIKMENQHAKLNGHETYEPPKHEVVISGERRLCDLHPDYHFPAEMSENVPNVTNLAAQAKDAADNLKADENPDAMKNMLDIEARKDELGFVGYSMNRYSVANGKGEVPVTPSYVAAAMSEMVDAENDDITRLSKADFDMLKSTYGEGREMPDDVKKAFEAIDKLQVSEVTKEDGSVERNIEFKNAADSRVITGYTGSQPKFETIDPAKAWRDAVSTISQSYMEIPDEERRKDDIQACTQYYEAQAAYETTKPVMYSADKAKELGLYGADSKTPPVYSENVMHYDPDAVDKDMQAEVNRLSGANIVNVVKPDHKAPYTVYVGDKTQLRQDLIYTALKQGTSTEITPSVIAAHRDQMDAEDARLLAADMKSVNENVFAANPDVQRQVDDVQAHVGYDGEHAKKKIKDERGEERAVSANDCFNAEQDKNAYIDAVLGVYDQMSPEQRKQMDVNTIDRTTAYKDFLDRNAQKRQRAQALGKAASAVPAPAEKQQDIERESGNSEFNVV